MNRRRVATGAAASVAGAAALVGGISVVARLVGFGRQVVFQSTVGPYVLGDVYTTANSLPNVVFEIVVGGALASIVVPVLASAAARGDTEQVKRTTSALLSWTLLLLIPVALLGVLVAGPLMSVMLEGNGGADAVVVGRRLFIIFLPQIPLYGVAVVTAGVLQAHRRFLAAATAPVVSSLVVAGAYVTFAEVFRGDRDDVTTLDPLSEAVLAGGTTLGVLALAVVTLLPMLRVTGVRPTLHFPPGIAARVRSLAAAGLVTLLSQQLAMVVAWRSANAELGDGAMVTYTNSWMVYLLPYAVLAVPIATAAFPRLTEHAGDRSSPPTAEYTSVLARTTRAVLLVCLLGTAVLIATSWPVARFFGLIGQSGNEEIDPTWMGWGLIAFAPGLLGYGLVALLGRALYARGRGRAAATATVSGWVTAAVAAMVLSALAPGRLVVGSLGLAHTLGMVVAGVLLIAAVHRDGGPAATSGLVRVFLVGTLAAALGGLAGKLTATLVPQTSGLWVLLAGVAAAAVTVVVTGVIVLAATPADTRNVLLRRNR